MNNSPKGVIQCIKFLSRHYTLYREPYGLINGSQLLMKVEKKIYRKEKEAKTVMLSMIARGIYVYDS